nr:hypothetical protein [Marinilabiliaceae bacterium A049]
MKNIYTLIIALAFLLISHLAFGQSYISGYPTVTNITTGGCDLNVGATGGTFYNHYYVVIPTSSTPPTIYQVKAGTDGDDNPITQSGSFFSPPDNITTQSINGLTSNTSYTAYFVTTEYFTSIDIETDNPTQISFSTLADPPSVSIYDPLNDATNVTASQSLILTFDQNIQFGATGPRLYINNADN